MRRTLIAVAAAAAVAIAVVVAVILTSGNGQPSTPGPAWPNSSNHNEAVGQVTLRLGFVTSIPQAPALVGLQDGAFASALHGSGITVQPVPFRTDAAEGTALIRGQLDAAYASTSSILADMASPGGTKIAIVSGASEGSAPVNLIATRAFLSAHSEGVLDLVKGQVQVNDLINHNLLSAAAAYTAELTVLTGQHLTASAVGAAFARNRFTDDPGAASLAAMVRDGQDSAARPALPTLYDIAPLDLLLRMEGERPVTT
jgi:ABC-type nitrate/sulfonate/bicarbonate transport system substrate-binding protein